MLISASAQAGQNDVSSTSVSPRLKSHPSPFWRRYVPFGKVDEVMPYLIRRAQENSAILAGEAVAGEMRMLRTELVRRLGLTLQPPRPES